MDITDVLFAFREAHNEKEKEIEMMQNAIVALRQEFAFLMANQGRIQHTVKEIAAIYGEHPNTTKERIRKYGVAAIGKRGRSFTYGLHDLEVATLFQESGKKPISKLSKKDYFRKYKKAS